MNIGIVLYDNLNRLRSLPFSLSDVLLVVFLHDIEKPWKYEMRSDGQFYHRPGMDTKAEHHEFRMKKLKEYGIVLTKDQLNGMKYVEGELNDYTNRRKMMGPLAALCHLADVTSARIWFDHPIKGKDKDPWTNAERLKKFEAP